MKLTIGGQITISDYTPEEEATITRGLSLLNPTYAVMKRQGNMRALYVVPEFIKYYKKQNNCLIVGRGVLPRLMRHFKSSIDSAETNLISKKATELKITKPIELRDYQIGIPEKILQHNEGIIKLSTGFGKSVVALKLIEKTFLKTLIVVPRLNLLTQFKQDIKAFLGYDCGVINGPHCNIKDITVATIQTLKKRDLGPLRYEFGMVIFDEVHTVISDQGMRVVSSFNPERLYGMTATPDRSDGQGEAIKFTFGDIIVDKELPQCKPTVTIVRCNEEYFSGTEDDRLGDTYANITELQSENETRNKMITELIKKELSDGRKILVLTKRTKHYEILKSMIDNYQGVSMIKSKLSAAEAKVQNELLEKLRTGSSDFNVILGTFSLLSTGINIPALDTIVLAGDLKSSVLTTQSVGRILRLFEEKKQPKIIDIDDFGCGILHNQARLRKNFYKSNGWEIL